MFWEGVKRDAKRAIARKLRKWAIDLDPRQGGKR